MGQRTAIYGTLIAILAAVVAFHWRTAYSIIEPWADNPFAHGYIVVPVAAYLAWTRREALASLDLRPTPTAIVPVACASLAWLAGSLTETVVLQQVALFALVVACVGLVLGLDAVRVLAFPLGLLGFALPFGDRLVPFLQDLTASFAVTGLQLTGIPVLLEGHVIAIPGGQWLVAEACGGINYLTSSLFVGYIGAGLTYRRWHHRIGFVVASALLPLAANGLRVYTTILIASLGGTSIATGMEHNLYGWVVFSLSTLALFGLCGRWAEDDISPPATAEPRRALRAKRTATVAIVTAGLLVVGSAPLSARWLSPIESMDTPARPDVVVGAPWLETNHDLEVWTPQALNGSTGTVRTYTDGYNLVKVFLAVRHNAEAHANVTETARPGWWVHARRSRVLEIGDTSCRAGEAVLRSQDSFLSVLRYYWVDGALSCSSLGSKLRIARARMTRRSPTMAIVAIAVESSLETDSDLVIARFLEHVSIRSVGR